MILIAAALTFVACAASFFDLRKGLVMVVLIGVLQDPLRKLTPGIPTFYILWSMVVFAVLVAQAWWRRGMAPLRTLWLYSPALKALWVTLAFLVFIQFGQAFVRWGPTVPILGVIEYVMPVFAVLFGAGLAAKQDGTIFFLKWYSLIVTPVALTVYLALRYGDALPVLRDVGSFTGAQLIIYAEGAALKSYAGLFRTGEIASWHAATAAVFLLILAQRKPSKLKWTLTAIAVVLLIGAIIFTGRRKMLMALTIFGVLQTWFATTLPSRVGRKWVVLLAFGVAAAILPGFLPDTSNVYVSRGMSVYAALEERSSTALDLARSAYDRAGAFGLGIGVFSQASRYAGIDLSAVVGGAGEAGIGKIILELGVPGLILLMVITLRTSVVAWRLMRWMARTRDPALPVVTSLGAYVAGQIATFTVATQVYGDPFVLIVLGLTAGCLFQSLASAVRRQRQWNAERHEAGRMVTATRAMQPVAGAAVVELPSLG